MAIFDQDDLTALEPSDGDACMRSFVRCSTVSLSSATSRLREFFTWFLAPPLERRRQEWMEDVDHVRSIPGCHPPTTASSAGPFVDKPVVGAIDQRHEGGHRWGAGCSVGLGAESEREPSVT